MRYLGNKTDMINNIEAVINENIHDNSDLFLDLFAGTGSVGAFFKKKYTVISNDFLYFSYSLAGAYILNNEIPKFDQLKSLKINDPIYFLNTLIPEVNDSYFITKNYSPYLENPRMYLSIDNAKKIDCIRQKIESWSELSLINNKEYLYLIATLIEATSKVSNTSGTYGAYLKSWDPRALKSITLEHFIILNNGKDNIVHNRDANELVKEIRTDICYLDPPYNGRQYSSNYHLLETIAKYDNPILKGITGIRKYASTYSSSFSKKSTVLSAFEDLIKNTNSKHILLSYSSDGLLTTEEIESILKKYGVASSYKCYHYLYKKYQSKIQSSSSQLYEYIFYIQKSTGEEISSSSNKKKKPNNTAPSIIQKDLFSTATNQIEILASPMNYIGGKYKLLPQILPLFPNLENSRFIDLFTGGLNVGINVQCEKIIANDLNKYVIEVLEYFYKTSIEDTINEIKKIINKYSLSKENQEGFIKLRNDYNNNQTPIMLYTLICYSFNYQFRFNNSHQYNNPFGKNRSQFSQKLEDKLIKFVKRLQSKKIIFSSNSFSEYLDKFEFNANDFVYCDPPYLITTGSYNDGNRGFKDWTTQQEKSLLHFLDQLDRKNLKFALSNVFDHKGQSNHLLKQWAKKYNTHYLNNNYSNSSYNTSKGDSTEVLVTNY